MSETPNWSELQHRTRMRWQRRNCVMLGPGYVTIGGGWDATKKNEEQHPLSVAQDT